MGNEKHLKELKEYSDSFTEFSIKTESAELFQKAAEEECAAYLRQIDNLDLSWAFLLYYPSDRNRILKELTTRLQIEILENMMYITQTDMVSLQKCIDAEKKIADVIKQTNERRLFWKRQ